MQTILSIVVPIAIFLAFYITIRLTTTTITTNVWIDTSGSVDSKDAYKELYNELQVVRESLKDLRGKAKIYVHHFAMDISDTPETITIHSFTSDESLNKKISKLNTVEFGGTDYESVFRKIYSEYTYKDGNHVIIGDFVNPPLSENLAIRQEIPIAFRPVYITELASDFISQFKNLQRKSYS